MKVLRKSHTHNRLVHILYKYIFKGQMPVSAGWYEIFEKDPTPFSSWYVLKLIPTQVPTLVSTD